MRKVKGAKLIVKDKKSFLKLSRKKIIIGVLAVALIGALAIGIFGRGKDENVYVSTVNLEKGDIEKSLSVTGTIKGTDSAEISSSLSYEIISINVKEGDYVSKGQVLAVLDGKDLRREIEMAKKDYELAVLQSRESLTGNIDTSIKAQEVQLEQSILEQEEAQRQVNIKKNLHESGAIPLEELIQSEIVLERANISVELARETLRKAKHDIEKAIEESRPKASIDKSLEIKRDVLKQKEEDLERLNIKSPIEGTVTRVNARLGRNAQNTDGNRPMFIIENLSDLKLIVSISEFDIARVSEGQEVEISADILGSDSIKGYVSRISPTGEARDQGGREMVIPVEIDIEGNDPRLIAGVSARGKVLIDRKEKTFTVPFETILEESGESYVLAVRDGIINKIKVAIGIEGDMNIEIISNDLIEGDEIILNPTIEQIDGMKVATASAQEMR